MDAVEWQHWIHIYNESPWGEEREDLRAGIIASTVASYAGKTLKDGVILSPDDFMPFAKARTEPKEQSAQDQVAAANMIAAALGVVNQQNK